MMRESVLLIEDDKLMRVTLEDALKAAGYDVTPHDSGANALKAFKENAFDIVVTDVRLPDADGLEILKDILEVNRDTQVILMTAYGTIKDAVEAMKLGAFDYITKPFALDEFLMLVNRAIEIRRLREENVRLKRDLKKCYDFPNIIGESDAMKKVFSLVERVAETDSTVLILGESGTGKELIATTIHYQSRRRDKPLIKVNCAALPEGLIESELFGYEKGAFTGAMKRKPGRFELASGGTIFLDEIGDLPLSTQSKILRVIQERAFERVGGTETIATDVRIIAATNKNLEEEVKAGRFREDLFYRINVVPVVMPSLRERRVDISPLAEFFVNKCGLSVKKDVKFSKEAFNAMLQYDYPGNVRELENIVERCVTLAASNLVTVDDLPPFITGRPDIKRQATLSDVSAQAEKDHIIRVLKETKGNKTRAAGQLGISRKTLWEKMNAYGIEV